MDLNRAEAYSTHDLIQFAVEGYEHVLPTWADRVDGRAWAVVRRAKAASAEFVAAGVRGRDRAERSAVDIRASDIVSRLSPEALITRQAPRLRNTDVARALRQLANDPVQWFGTRGWGPAGSVGFELATGLPVVRRTSDLDLVVRAVRPVSPSEATAMLGALATLPCRADCLLETPTGAVALAEWAASGGGEVLLRTGAGPQMTRDPWHDAFRTVPG